MKDADLTGRRRPLPSAERIRPPRRTQLVENEPGDAQLFAGTDKRAADEHPAAKRSAATTETDKRAKAALAGLSGDPAGARPLLRDPSPRVRCAALGALARLGAVTREEGEHAVCDEDPIVRRTACELAGAMAGADFLPLLKDQDETVIEAAAYALGELGDRRALPGLIEIAASHSDPLCRESAVAALGAIGDDRATDAIIAALVDIPAIRRRAVIALSAFSGPLVSAALRDHQNDRDWQVRQAVEDILEISGE